jgi:hypothetical protein
VSAEAAEAWNAIAGRSLRYAIAIVILIALGPLGCIAQIGGTGVVFGIGEVEACSGAYSYDDETGRWTCEGNYVAGAAISDSGARALGGVADAARSTAASVLGLPQPQPPPKQAGP